MGTHGSVLAVHPLSPRSPSATRKGDAHSESLAPTPRELHQPSGHHQAQGKQPRRTVLWGQPSGRRRSRSQPVSSELAQDNQPRSGPPLLEPRAAEGGVRRRAGRAGQQHAPRGHMTAGGSPAIVITGAPEGFCQVPARAAQRVPLAWPDAWRALGGPCRADSAAFRLQVTLGGCSVTSAPSQAGSLPVPPFQPQLLRHHGAHTGLLVTCKNQTAAVRLASSAPISGNPE